MTDKKGREQLCVDKIIINNFRIKKKKKWNICCMLSIMHVEISIPKPGITRQQHAASV